MEMYFKCYNFNKNIKRNHTFDLYADVKVVGNKNLKISEDEKKRLTFVERLFWIVQEMYNTWKRYLCDWCA